MVEEIKKEKILYVVSHGADDPERATLPFVHANGALAMDVEAVVVLLGPAVMLARKGCMNHVFAGGMPPLKKLVEEFLAQGGRLLLCTPCIQFRQIDQSELIEEAKPIAAAVFTEEVLSANAVLNY
ncbi:MAG: DsrE family protein [Thermodesulfobacteriota bacterium]